MDFNNFVNQLNWKKIVVIAIGAMVLLFILHEIFFWHSLKEAQSIISSLNAEISNHQKEIKNKLAESDKEFSERNKTMNDFTNNVADYVDNEIARSMRYMEIVSHEREERDKKFDKAFADLPDQLMKMHEKMGKEMKNNFLRQTEQMQKDFQKRQQTFFTKSANK